MRNTIYKDAAKRRQEWAEAAKPPATPDCQHEVLVLLNKVLTCTKCEGRAVVA